MVGENTEDLRKITEYTCAYDTVMKISPDSNPYALANHHTPVGLKHFLNLVRQIPQTFLDAKSPREKAAFERNKAILEDVFGILERGQSAR